MFLIRPSSLADIESLFLLAGLLDTSNLPADKDRLRNLLERSRQAFHEEDPTLARTYCFVLEDKKTSRVIGASLVHAQHGTREAPLLAFEICEDARNFAARNCTLTHPYMRLWRDYDGPTEIGGLILHPSYRRHPVSLGRLLSLVRFVFIAMHRSWFRSQILAELLPPLTPEGTNCFWEYIGRRFTGLSYSEANALLYDGEDLIEGLFPQDALYIDLFPQDVREAIAQVGPATQGVVKMLTRVGFSYANRIHPFDGGPHYTADTDTVDTIANSRKTKFQIADMPTEESMRCIVATEGKGTAKDFCAVITKAHLSEEAALVVSQEAADLLAVDEDQELWWTPV